MSRTRNGRTTPKGTVPAQHTRNTTKKRRLTMVRSANGKIKMYDKGVDIRLGETHVRMTSQQLAVVKALDQMPNAREALIGALAQEQRAESA